MVGIATPSFSTQLRWPELAISSRSLQGLPLETLMAIQCLVEPLDIISLRKCCKSLHAASSQRLVWIAALRRVCFEYNAFFHSFPVYSMSLLELEHAATASFGIQTFLSDILKGDSATGNSKIPHVSTQSLGLTAAEQAGDEDDLQARDGRFRSVTLVSGGRFLITLSTLRRVELWDLGYNSTVPINALPLASIYIEGLDVSGHWEVLVHPSSDGLGFVVLVLRALGSQRSQMMEVLQVHPLQSNPIFESMGSLARPDLAAMDAYLLTEDRVICHTDCVSVWNFIENTSVSWNDPEDCVDMIVYRNTIVLMGTERLRTCRIPPLYPLDHNISTASQKLVHPPSPVYTPTTFHVAHYSYPLSWIPHHHEQAYHFFAYGFDNSTSMDLFTLQRNPNTLDSALPDAGGPTTTASETNGESYVDVTPIHVKTFACNPRTGQFMGVHRSAYLPRSCSLVCSLDITARVEPPEQTYRQRLLVSIMPLPSQILGSTPPPPATTIPLPHLRSFTSLLEQSIPNEATPASLPMAETQNEHPSPLSPPAESTSPAKSAVLWEWSSVSAADPDEWHLIVHPRSWAFCPVSGRACVLSPDAPTKITVVDYLPVPKATPSG